LGARLLWHWWRHVTGRPSMDDELEVKVAKLLV
jgi:hypothetical protein